MSAIKRAMVGPAKCVLWLNRSKMRTLADFCWIFLDIYGSQEKVMKEDLKNRRIDWYHVERYSNKVQELSTKFTTIDDNISHQELCKIIVNMDVYSEIYYFLIVAH